MSLEPPAAREAENAAPVTVPSPVARVTRYEVSCLPQADPNADLFTLTVEERSPGRWAVLQRGFCFDLDGVREYESIPSERAAEFRARFRFDLDTALELAAKIAPTITVNGHTVADALARAGA
jgi:hypothetical protein